MTKEIKKNTKRKINEILRLKIEAHSVYGICKDISKEEFKRQMDAYKKYIDVRNRFVKEQK